MDIFFGRNRDKYKLIIQKCHRDLDIVPYNLVIKL